ncbi:potassium-transporting ATPase subunit F [Arthrobacter sp. 35W]|nr:potassium-transporting ATPase subunit F [Arthrobacter sp. 35W]
MSSSVLDVVLAVVLLAAGLAMLVYLFAALIRPEKW